MSELYLHIGTPKTGTSAIQAMLRENSKVLKKQGCIFPNFHLSYSELLPHSARNAHWLVHKECHSEAADQCFDQLKEYAQKYEKIILSDESLWYQTIWHDEDLEYIRGRLDEIGLTVKVIVYFRPQTDLLYSLWGQFVKAEPQMGLTFDEYAASLSKNQKNKRFNYLGGLEHLEHFCDKEDIIVRVYDSKKVQEDTHYYLNNFLEAVGLSAAEIEYSERRVNISLKDRYQETKRLLNRGNTDGENNFYLVGLLRGLQMQSQDTLPKHPRPYFSPAAKNRMMEKYRADNSRIAEEYLHLPAGTDLFPPEEDDGETVDNTFTEEEILHVIDQLIQVLHDERTEQKNNIRSMSKNLDRLTKAKNRLDQMESERKSKFSYRLKRKLKKIFHS